MASRITGRWTRDQDSGRTTSLLGLLLTLSLIAVGASGPAGPASASPAPAEIVDADHAWVAFASNAPEEALGIIGAFTNSHKTVSVDVRTDLGFNELELEEAIATVHFAVLQRSEVRDASTSFDFETLQITTTATLESTASASVLDDLRAAATKELVDAGLVGILDSITLSVVRSNSPVIGGEESNTQHLGAEALSHAPQAS